MENELKFCYTKKFAVAETHSLILRAVAYKEKYWSKGHNLKIFFMGGTSTQKANMKSVISEMLSTLSLTATYVNSANESDIRISFQYGYGSYSYLGTDALFIRKSEETLNIGWDGRDVMYHEFGHALNLAHEHQNSKKGIVWNEAQVIADLSGEPNKWTIAQIKYNVLDKISAELSDSTNFDPDSVMLYYIPKSWTMDGFQSNDNIKPSANDMAFLREKYNFTVVDEIAPLITLNGGENIILQYKETYTELGATALDNKDGDITSKIKIEGTVDSTSSGLHFVIYTVSDTAGNVATKTRTILVKEQVIDKNVIIKLYRELFPTKQLLGRLTEPQLVTMATKLDINASVDDLKVDTVNKVWNNINYN